MESRRYKELWKKKTKITSVNVRSKKLKVSFGKKNNALIDIELGEIECLAEKNDEFEKAEINFKNNNIIKK